MAQKAKKEQAKANITALKNLHTFSLAFNGFFLLLSLTVCPRSFLYYFILSIPAFACQIIIERSGRPTYDPSTKALRSVGVDLNNPGLTDFMFDIIWVTWACLVLVILFGNGAWFIYSLVPAFALYKTKGLLVAGRAMMGGGMPPMPAMDETPAPRYNRKQHHQA